MKKILKLSLLVVFIMAYFLPYFTYVSASVTGTISGDEVNLREKPTTSSSKSLAKLNKGTQVEVLNDSPVSGSGCSSGWINVKYNNITGYVCYNYLYIPGKDVYGRPWTSPKKAIIGGAKFIGSQYIHKSQYTSYLKKFNVASKNLYTHQYMGNLRAPWSEAKTSYNAYLKAGVLSSPLVFSIPIYENMNDAYPLPGTEFNNSAVDEVLDQEFEAKLDEQGFPESYKRRLRYIHKEYPNWVFESIKTNLDFNSVIDNEYIISVIDGSNLSYRNSKNYSYEKGWYTPNRETAAYFLDPRNFIFNKERILQFEKLYFSEIYTESTVQAVLNNTFMSGLSAIDNQSYASIFMEAGRINNVNPVYLASLAKQEVGTNGSKATSGAEFTYKDKTYKGLYNFFNIGAYASEASPVLAGLVWGSVGYDYATVVQTIIDTSNQDGSDEEEETTIAQTEQKPNNSEVTPVVEKKEPVKVIKKGDLNDDNVINSADLLKVRQHLLGTITLTGDYFKAGDVDGNGVINSADLLRVRQHLLGTKIIE